MRDCEALGYNLSDLFPALGYFSCMKEPYQIVIGLEIHIQMLTRRKLFSTESAGQTTSPNTQVSVITWAHPGVLPQLNTEALRLGVRMGLATHCEIDRHSRFARKHYFYPDLPKGYQRTQSDRPLCREGYLDIWVDRAWQRIAIERIHVEEDAGKSIHDQDLSASFVDLNRAGTPLLELVTRPELHSIQAAVSFLAEIRRMVRYLGVSDGDMEKGNLRCDVNVSLRANAQAKLGTRVEVKNINSFSFLQRAIEFEVARQTKLLDAGASVQQETRAFDARNGSTLPMRSKENVQDYRYFIEPDLPPLNLPEQWLKEARALVVTLPMARWKVYTESYGIGESEAMALVEDRHLSDLLESSIAEGCPPRPAANWLLGPISAALHQTTWTWEQIPLSPAALAELIDLVETGAVSHHDAKEKLLPALLATPSLSASALADHLGIRLVSQAGKIAEIMQAIMAAHPEEVHRYRAGKKGLLGFFVGKVMRELGGGADPKEVNLGVVAGLESGQ